MKARSGIKSLLYSVIFIILLSHIANAQYEPITTEQLQAKLIELEGGQLKDSIFWATIGFMRNEKIRFSQVTENTLYVNTQGVYYRIDLSDGVNIAVSCIYFMPHNRKINPEYTDSVITDTTIQWAPNEHLCLCNAKVGYAVVVKNGGSFECGAVRPEWDIDENIDVNCHDTETLSKYVEKYYNTGIAFSEKLQTIPPVVKILEEE
ncbi:MAG: hypothetical protein LBO69_05445 [Ignavibacteria bacterium]|jgi:hypothetical protein|nr:hypothetical protein [Ignavibacteria bacterium]